LLKYQLLRSLEFATGAYITLDAKMRILQDYKNPNPTNHLTPQDILFIDFDAFDCPFNQKMVDDIKVNLLKQTAEYIDTINTLNYPRDLFREINRLEPGFTVDYKKNAAAPLGTQKRQDFIFAFDSLKDPSTLAEVQVLPLKCNECQVVPFGSTAQTQLTDHFSLEAVLSVQ